ncbi:MAG: GNAT family N-acetyltransferase [Candidatus Marinimicrobia bacterium]|nr:GNAT family N-acetyltransferase [Candidatus Neomarinimicrobiota bacterium]
MRNYSPERDFESVKRIWLECGWIKPNQGDLLELYLKGQHAWVTDIQSVAECLVIAADGDIQYMNEPLSMSCLTGVTTSHIARKQGIAGDMTARAIAEMASQGAAVCTLGMFEQGYYNRLGFGTGGYEHFIAFDPSQLKIMKKPRIPKRLTKDDAALMHKSRLNRKRGNGACNLFSQNITSAEFQFADNGFGLGYVDDNTGELTHHIGFSTKNYEYGPYNIRWMTYQNDEQFLELLGVVKSMEEQVRLVTVREPKGLQFQDFLEKPFSYGQITHKSVYEHQNRAVAYWQLRICNLAKCISAVHTNGEALNFNLHLYDPIEKYLDDSVEWHGISGNYTITLGKESAVESGIRDDLPTLTATVSAFSRLWLGAVPASGLRLTEKLDGPEELILRLDDVFRLPQPSPDWDF